VAVQLDDDVAHARFKLDGWLGCLSIGRRGQEDGCQGGSHCEEAEYLHLLAFFYCCFSAVPGAAEKQPAGGIETLSLAFPGTAGKPKASGYLCQSTRRSGVMRII